MTESTEGQPFQSGGESEGVDEDVEGRPEDRRDAAGATPPISGEEQGEGTTSPAAEDDVGVPPDEEMGQPTE